MSSFFTTLEKRVRETGSLLCIGLDPHPQDLPAPTAEAALDFCRRLIDATAPSVAAFKPNAAFFEAFGAEGMRALQQVIAAVPKGIPVILDAKRGDIASTAEAYARAVFETLGAGAVTLSPYLGYDSLEPFLRDPARGVFLLCKTSNPGAADLQDLLVEVEGSPLRLYEAVARRAQGWNTQDNLGLVVGATQPESLRKVRALAPGLWILAPGVGAQGGDLEQALAAGLRPDGSGVLLPVSRAVSRAADPAQAAEELRLRMNRFRDSGRSRPAAASPVGRLADRPLLESIAAALLDSGCVRFGEFTLKSGLVSPIYIDLRRLVGSPALLARVAVAYSQILGDLEFDRLAALPYAALPIATAISLHGGWPLVYPRKEVKEYGTRAEVEGIYAPGERVAVIDDLATTGGSKFEAIEKLAAAGLQVTDVVVLVDRQSGAAEALARAGYRMHAVFTLTALLESWQQSGQVSAEQAAAVRQFLAQTGTEG